MAQLDQASVDRLAAGRDRALDAARALAMVAVAVGHWLVAEPVAGPDGLMVRDVLAVLPGAAHLTWLFQVIPLFMVAGFAAGVPSWRRHRERGGTAGGWVARRVWRLLWPTLIVVAFWTLLTQVGDHLLGLDSSLLAATRGIGLVLWFLAIYVVLTALLPTLDRLAERFGTVTVMLGFVMAALTVDVVAAATGYVSSIEPSWVWVNYLLWWAPVGLAGRWWDATRTAAGRWTGTVVAGVALVALMVVTAVGWYPVAMVGVTGQARSNTLPPTLALALLAAVQIGVLFATAERLRTWLAAPGRYVPVAVVGSRAMTIYLWHLLAPVVVTLSLVLPGMWPAPAVGSGTWWAARLAWVVVNALVTLPVVLALGRFEQPPARWAVTDSGPRVVVAVVLCVVGWAAVAITGLHVPAWPASVPWLQITALGGAALLLLRTSPR
ncbi:MAG TPA: acyltransferase family protein [Egibacteraceae bacterium]|nr:acyltransferase family protein [Egibacteraceae bacterium]